MAEQRATNITWHGGSIGRADRERLLGQRGVTVWLTGLSAAGKSTIAVILERMLIERGRLAYRLDRDAVRSLLAPGEFVEVYVKVSVEAAERRDPKGLYKKARAGEIKGFTGIDDPYEEPDRAEIVIDTEASSPEDSA